VHFSNEEDGEAKTQIGTADGVRIPDEYLATGEPIYAYIFLHDGDDDGETVYKVKLPVRKRPAVSDEEPTPAEQSAISQAIELLNTAVDKAEQAAAKFTTDTALTEEGVAADAKVVGNEIEKLKAADDNLSKKIAYEKHISSGLVLYESNNGSYDYTSSLTQVSIRKTHNVIDINGRYAATGRMKLTGDFAVASTNPTYKSKPEWYGTPLEVFSVGKEYYVAITLISGSYEFTDSTKSLYVDLRNRSSDVIGRIQGSGTWVCTELPELILLGFQNGTYTNAKIMVEIYEIGANNDPYYVPYYFASQLSSAIAKIQTDINSDKTVGPYGTDIESFVFITDPHWNENKKHSPGLIKEILEKTSVNTVICGGDIINSHNPTKEGAVAEIRDFTKKITDIATEYYAVFGNHDDNSNGGSEVSIQFTKAEQFNLLYGPFANQKNVHWIFEDIDFDMKGSVKNDYYFDHQRTKTRFLCLDWNNPVNEQRQTWAKKILELNDNYRIIVVYHGFFVNDGSGGVIGQHTGWLDFLEPYKSKIACMVSGHIHLDTIQDYYGDGTTPIIVTSCDKFSENAGAIADSVNEQCFDVVVVDYKNSVIKLTRLGRGTDRTVSFALE